YYLAEFISRAELLIPVALLLSTIKVLTTLNLHRELVALAVSGISLKRILRPFWITALFCTALLYINFQWGLPSAWHTITQFEERFFDAAKEESQVHSLQVKDGSYLFYRHFDAKKEHFCTLFWVESTDRIYKMESLDPFSTPPVGRNVTVF